MSDEQKKPEAASTAIVQWDPQSATEAWQLAKYYGQSELLPKSLRSTGDIFVTIAAGRDFGWSPMQSMRAIYVVEGKPSLSADAMVGIAKSSGVCEYFLLVESTPEKATYRTKRKGDPAEVVMSFTIEEAQRAGLTGKKGPWASYPARMLRNRCKSALAKEVFEELFFGVYEESEAAEIAAPRQIVITKKVTPEDAAALKAPDVGRTITYEPAPPTPASEATVEVARSEPEHAPAEQQSRHDDWAPTKAELLMERLTQATPETIGAVTTEIKAAHDRREITETERTNLAAAYVARRKEHEAKAAEVVS